MTLVETRARAGLPRHSSLIDEPAGRNWGVRTFQFNRSYRSSLPSVAIGIFMRAAGLRMRTS